MSEAMYRAQQVAGDFDFAEHLLAMRVGTAVQPMHQAIDSRTRVKNVDRPQHVARIGEVDFDGIVHAAAAVNLRVRSVGPTREDVRSFTLTGDVAVVVFELVPVITVGPIQPTIGAKKAAMNAGRVAVVAELVDDDFALVGDAVVVGVGQSPNVRWRGDVQRSVVPGTAHRKRHLVGEHGRTNRTCRLGRYRQVANRIGKLFFQFLVGHVDAGVVANVQPTVIVETGHRRMRHQWRTGGQFDRESVGNLIGAGLKPSVSGGGSTLASCAISSSMPS